MKKSVAVLFMFLIFIFMGGCKSLSESRLPQLDFSAKKEAKISFDGLEYECEIYHNAPSVTSVSFISPDNLKGFTISQKCGEYKIFYGSLEAEYSKSPLANNSKIKFFMDIFDSLSGEEQNFILKNEEDGEKIYKGTVNNNECEVILSKKNDLIKISVLNLDITAEFKG